MRMLGKRSTVEVLEAKGIYQSAAVFGCALEKQNLDQCRALSGKTIDVPRIIWKTVAKLESKKELLETDGLYRVSGDAARIQKIRLDIDQGNWDSFDSCNDPHILSGTLKLFLRELPEPVLPYTLHSELVLAATGKGPHGEDIARSMDAAISKIQSKVILDCLEVLVLHLGKVAQAVNRMDIDNLGLLFGQVLLWPDPNAPVDLKFVMESAKNCQVADALIRYGAEIFHHAQDIQED